MACDVNGATQSGRKKAMSPQEDPTGDDRRPAGDPRDPRGDLPRRPLPPPPPRRRLARWPFLTLAALVVTAVAAQPELLLADLRLTAEVLGFAVLIGAPLVVGVLWADRRWPAGRRRDDDRPPPP